MTWKQQEATDFKKWVQREMLIKTGVDFLDGHNSVNNYIPSPCFIALYACFISKQLFVGISRLNVVKIYLFIAPPTIKAISDITLQNLCKFIQNNIPFTLLWNVWRMRWDLFPKFYKPWWIKWPSWCNIKSSERKRALLILMRWISWQYPR